MKDPLAAQAVVAVVLAVVVALPSKMTVSPLLFPSLALHALCADSCRICAKALTLRVYSLLLHAPQIIN